MKYEKPLLDIIELYENDIVTLSTETEGDNSEEYPW